MAFSVECPGCGSKLRTGTAIPAGRKVACPSCKNTFVIGEGDVTDEATAPAKAKAPVAAASKRARDEELEDFDDDVEEDEEEEPEEKPKPKPKKKKKKKKKSQTLFLVCIGLVSVLLVGGLGYFFYTFLFSTADKEMMVFLPADATMIAGVQVEELLVQEKPKEWLKKDSGKLPPEVNDVMKPLNLTYEDITTVLAAQSKSCGSTTVMRVRSGKEMDQAGLMKLSGAKEATAGTRKYVKFSGGTAFLPSPRILVLMELEAGMKKALERTEDTITLTEETQSLVNTAARGGQVWVVGPDIKGFGDAYEAVNALAAKKGPNPLKGIKSGAIWFSVGTDDVTLGIGVMYGDAESATTAAKDMNKILAEFREEDSKTLPKLIQLAGSPGGEMVKSGISKTSIDSSGSLLTFSTTVPMKPIESMMSRVGSSGNQGNMGMPQPQPQTPPQPKTPAPPVVPPKK